VEEEHVARPLVMAIGQPEHPQCPWCQRELEWVGPGPFYLNEEQWASLKAGDYFVESCELLDCPGINRGQVPSRRYFRD
jgi:hypothetical protein